MGWWDYGQIGFRCDDIYRNQVKDSLIRSTNSR